MRNLNKGEFYSKIDRFRDQYNLNNYPIDAFKLCDTLGIKQAAVNFHTAGLRGMACVGGSYVGDVILLNANRNAIEQNYDCLHEIIHIKFQGGAGIKEFQCFDKIRESQDSYLEWQANEGAAEVSVPYRVIIPMVVERYNELLKDVNTYAFCEGIAPYFNVTPQVIQYRLDNLKYEISQAVRGTPIRQVQILSKSQQENRGIAIKSLNELETERLSAMW